MQKFAHLAQLHIWIPSTHLLNLQEIVSLTSDSSEAAGLLLSSESHLCFLYKGTFTDLQAEHKNVLLFITLS